MLKHLLPLTLAAALAAPAGALASTASVENGAVTWRGTAAADGTPDAKLYVYAPYDNKAVVQITGPGVTAGAGCTPYDGGNGDIGAECPNTADWHLDAAGGDDAIVLMSDAAGSVDIDLGDGADSYETWAVATVHGGAGDDVIASSKYESSEGNDDHYFGDGGNDLLIGGYGADELRGGDGDDTLIGDGATGETLPDVLDGGAGVDTVKDYVPVDESKGKTAKVTLDGVANDGFPGEGDNVMVENVVSYAALDFTGDGGANAASFAYQDGHIDPAGPSTYRGQAGPDTLTGTLRDDRFEVRDGEVDDVACGAGADTVVADAEDRVAADCETVERPAPVVVAPPAPAPSAAPVVVTPAPAPSAAPVVAQAVASIKVPAAPRLRMALKKGVRVVVPGQPGATVAVKALRAGKVVGTGKAIAAPSGAATVRVTFAKAARKKLRRAKSVTLTLTAGAATASLTLKR